jgi:RNA polymerase primary sigma factor
MRQLKIIKSITNRESDSLDKYFQEIGRIELIDTLEEVRLAWLIREWDQQALEKLIKANLRFVVSVAKQYQNQWLSLPDLINEGNIWLVKAAQRFDETRGFKFISYAVWWIRQWILQAIAEQSRIVRLPINKVGQIHKANKMNAKLEQVHEREPTDQEIAEALEMEESQITWLFAINGKQSSLDKSINDDNDMNTPLSNLESTEDAPDRNLIVESLRKEISRALTTLTDKESEIIQLYYGLNGNPPLTLDEIGEKINLTRERVRQIKEKGIRRLKHSSRSKTLKWYLW